MDIREHPPVRYLTIEYINEALKQTTQIQQNLENVNNNSSNKLFNNDSIENMTSNDFNNSGSQKNIPKSVILAPFGLSATLTGHSFQFSDQQSQKIINEWCEFFPLPLKDEKRDNLDDLPPLVEVISGECLGICVLISKHFANKFFFVNF